MFFTGYFNTAIAILDEYKGDLPFHHFIKQYFAAHKKFGSRDRRYITELCYSFFRLGKSLAEVAVAEKLSIALLLCHTEHPVLASVKPQWNDIASKNLATKLDWVSANYSFTIGDIFPFTQALSPEIDHTLFNISFLIQPLLYLRIRPGKKKTVLKHLETASHRYELLSDNCIALPNMSKIDQLIALDKEAVVQDMNSQQVLEPFIKHQEPGWRTVWDCCAASGGKSILLKDTFPQCEVTVSDIRKSIVANLRERFKKAGIKEYTWKVIDVATEADAFPAPFDLIICDAPCSGSGTWSRTPEQLYFFNEDKISDYARLQKKIVSNAVRSLSKEGWFLYITCSVFAAENEAVVQYMQQHLSMQLIAMQYYKGYTGRADTLFVALLQL